MLFAAHEKCNSFNTRAIDCKRMKKEKGKKEIIRLVSIVSRRLLAINFRNEGVKLTQRVPRLTLAPDINVYTCLAGQKANKAIVPRGLRKG